METGLEQTQQLGRFLADVERRAYRIAVVALRDRDDALGVVQGAMLRLVRSYRKRPSDEWRPLFCRILYNGIRDWRRRQAVRSRMFARRRPSAGGEDELFVDPVDLGADGWSGPGDRAMHAEAMQRLEQAIGELPLRQQQAFALGVESAQGSPGVKWEELSPAQQEVLHGMRSEWDQLPPQRQATRSRRAQRWETMTPEQRAGARQRFERWRSMPPEQRQRMRERWQEDTRQQGEQLRKNRGWSER